MGASRKFVYQQMHKAGAALDDAFLSAAPDEEALFALTVTKTWLRRVIVRLALICHSSYRGVVEFLRDLLGISISVGTVHQVLQLVTQKAGVLRAKTGCKFHTLFVAVSKAMAQTPRSSSLVENLNTGKSPRELMTGQGHAHWLTLLDLGRPTTSRTDQLRNQNLASKDGGSRSPV
jgi:hypothetical protein